MPLITLLHPQFQDLPAPYSPILSASSKLDSSWLIFTDTSQSGQRLLIFIRKKASNLCSVGAFQVASRRVHSVAFTICSMRNSNSKVCIKLWRVLLQECWQRRLPILFKLSGPGCRLRGSMNSIPSQSIRYSRS